MQQLHGKTLFQGHPVKSYTASEQAVPVKIQLAEPVQLL